MNKKFRVVISSWKETEHAFLVALVRTPPIPLAAKSVSGYAVIAANMTDDDSSFSYAHLEQDEKEAIGDWMLKMDAPVNQWWWCQLFDETDENNLKDYSGWVVSGKSREMVNGTDLIKHGFSIIDGRLYPDDLTIVREKLQNVFTVDEDHYRNGRTQIDESTFPRHYKLSPVNAATTAVRQHA